MADKQGESRTLYRVRTSGALGENGQRRRAGLVFDRSGLYLSDLPDEVEQDGHLICERVELTPEQIQEQRIRVTNPPSSEAEADVASSDTPAAAPPRRLPVPQQLREISERLGQLEAAVVGLTETVEALGTSLAKATKPAKPTTRRSKAQGS
ncbi:MAG: hypothetical protein AAGN66_17865 [Acidobacteriota bacterium]